MDGIKILVVEDSPVSRQAIIARLGKTPAFNLVQVADGRDALNELEDKQFTLLVTDLKMPHVDGLELVREIRSRKEDKFQKLPILIVSEGSAKKEDVVGALKEGADDYLLKPFDPDLLIQKVEALLQAKPPAREIPQDRIDALPKVLSQKEIDALLSPQGEGTGKRGKRKSSKRRGSRSDGARTGQKASEARPIISYDFKHPARVSKEQQRTLENLHSNLARMMASAFSRHQRSVVDVDIAFVDQTTYAEFIMSLSNPSCSYTFLLDPMGGPAVLDYSMPVVSSFIHCEFGGTKEPPRMARPLTSIERSIMAQVVTRNLADLETTWEPLLKVQVSDAELETNPEFMQVAAPSDTVILIAFEVNSKHTKGLVNLCYPYFTLEPVLSLLNVRPAPARRRSRGVDARQKRLDMLKTVDTEIQVIWGRGELSVGEVTALREGDTIVLDTRADDPAIVYVEDQPLFLGQPGVSPKGPYTVELHRTLPPVDFYDPLYLNGRYSA